jgi:transcriptional regulator of acetoin/glycerol metabolism
VEASVLYDWPMNVRELRTVVDRLAIDARDGAALQREDLWSALKLDREAAPNEEPTPEHRNDTTEPPSREALHALLEQHDGNIEAVANSLGRHRQQIYRWLKLRGLSLSDFRRPKPRR